VISDQIMAANMTTFRVSGNVAELWACREPDVLFHGPRGTGKTRPLLELLVAFCIRYQGTRIFISRKTRASMSQSTLVTLELVLSLRHPSALTGCMRSHVTSYWIGKSEVVIMGLDDESKTRGGEFACGMIDEAHEVGPEELDSLAGTLRWPIGGWRTLYLASNPDSDKHPIWLRVLDGLIHAIRSNHEDNPAVTKEFLARLARLPPGVRRKRYFEGIWCAAEGQVLEEFEEDENVITLPNDKDGKPDYNQLSISWYFASVDWGMTHAGCIGVWGVSLDPPSEGRELRKCRLYEVAEVYHSGKTPSWWVDQIAAINEDFKLAAIVCDPQNPGMIAEFNTRLGYDPKAPDAIAFGANNKRGTMSPGDIAGIGLLKEWVGPTDEGKRRVFWVRDNLRHPIDTDLRERGLPCSSLEEIPSYIWGKSADGKPLRDVTDKDCQDHGMDMTRYAVMFARDKDFTSEPRVLPDDPESYGALYGHNAMVAAMKLSAEGYDFDEALGLIAPEEGEEQ
jgi:hypothetical protein